MGESSEPRLDFIQEFTLRSLRLKPDKWARMIVFDEQRTFINNFLERGQFFIYLLSKKGKCPRIIFLVIYQSYIVVNPEFVTLLFVTQKNCHPVITFDFNN